MATNYNNIELNGKKAIIGETALDASREIDLLIGFHGADSTPENILIYANKLQLENTMLLFPEGPVDAGKGLWSWWLDGPRQADSVLAFVQYTDGLIDAIRNHLGLTLPGATIKVNLWGFSQGGAASLVYALFTQIQINKIASICGFLPELPVSTSSPQSPIDILGIYGTNDGVVPSFLAEYALEEIANKGHKVTMKETAQGHEISDENLKDVSAFLKTKKSA